MRALFFVFFGVLVALGQECERPLAGNDLKDLLTKRVSEVMVRQLITTCGLTMTVDDAAERDLKRLGASEPLVQLIREKATSASRTELELRAEVEYWSAIKESSDAAVYEDYLKRYPKGRFVVPAQAKLRNLAGVERNGAPPIAPRTQITNTDTSAIPAATSVPVKRKGPAPAPVSWQLQHFHPSNFSWKGKSCKGTLTVSVAGVAFRPEMSDGHSIDILVKDLNAVRATAFPGNYGIKINSEVEFFGLKKQADGEALFDAIDDVMRYAGKFEGDETATDVAHSHGLVKYCKGRLTITSDALQFESGDHKLAWRRGEYSIRLRPSSATWEIEIYDDKKRIAELTIWDWVNSAPLRSLWGKPTVTDKKNWQHWE